MDLKNQLAIKTAKVELLKSWLAGLGCEINPKLFYPFEENGVYSTITNEDLSPGEILTIIKPSAILSTELLPNSSLQRIFLCHPEFFGKENPEGLDNQYLTLVIHERSKKQNSIFKYFFEVLPKSVENLCDWTKEELTELQDPDLLEDIQLRSEKYWKSYTELVDILNSFPHFFPEPVTLSDVEWCWKVIWTRCFMRSAQHSALVPFADFFNHGESSTSFYFLDQTDNFQDFQDDYDEIMTKEPVELLTCKDLFEICFAALDICDISISEVREGILAEAIGLQNMIDEKKKRKVEEEDNVKDSEFVVAVGKKQRYSAGSQVLLEYGNYSNTSLLIHYGFTILNNRHEFYRLKVKLGDLLTPAQRKYLPVRFNPNSLLVFNLNTKELNRDLLRYLRAITWTPEAKRNSFFSQTDLNTEINIMCKYLDLLNQQLELFPTTILQDRCSYSNTHRQKFAVSFNQIIYRIEKKRVLLEQISLINTAIDSLNLIKSSSSWPINLEIPTELTSYFECISYYLTKENLFPPNANIDSTK